MSYDPDSLDWQLPQRDFDRTIRIARVLRPYFRPIYTGFEQLRGPGGLLLAGNHGLFGLDMPLLLLGVHDLAHRQLRSFSDHVLFVVPPVRRALMSFGVCEGTPAVAHKILSRGEIGFTCPGGAREALAPASERYKLDWDGRYGFVRSAIRAGVSIVPLASIGSDEIYRQLMDAKAAKSTPLGHLIARVAGEKYVTPLYIGIGPLPLPQRLHFLAGKPIAVPKDPAAANDETVVRALHAEAKQATEALIAQGLAAREERRRHAKPGLEKFVDEWTRRLAG
jgi:1-acyl-sn-glycerol-3-phosphate acyltransferase